MTRRVATVGDRELNDTPRRSIGTGTHAWQTRTMSALSPTPKLDGNRVALRGRVFPDQWKRAHLAADTHGLSLSDYLGALIDRDAGLPNKIDNSQQEALPIAKAS